ncbi:hypothetical protein BKA62DRAFT_714253 [Auriculariales sp. MPI-PUGE-AT-0066]|nr:hypothetical protein BKA62DRAFT_714253 [Auriculariales sp. MPI-PUGE-AT-0066]
MSLPGPAAGMAVPAPLTLSTPPHTTTTAMTSTSLEDIVNMDMLGLTNDDTSSPESSFLGMPPTPPQVPDASNVSELFKFYFDQHLNELAKQQQPMPFSFGSPLFAQPIVAQPDPNFFAIDPSLMTMTAAEPAAPNPVPSASVSKTALRSSSSIADDEDDHDDEDEDDDDIEQFLARPAKVAGRGKASGRKGTVSGGIKKFGGQAVKDSDDPEDWRPTVDEYKKMTPKEKRQLRNKISARNFRVRRKEYITTLEGDVSERDKLIDLIREELGATKLENEALKREVDALKRAMLEGRVELDLPPPGPLSPATNSANKRTTRSNKSGLAKPNTRKDVARSGSSFWGGVAGAGGVAQVHTTLVPDFAFNELQENINPAMNSMPLVDDHLMSSICEPPINPTNAASFDQFTDSNPFTMRSLDQYRMQMWGRLAREAGPGALNAALGINAASVPFSHPSPPSDPASPSSNPGLAFSSDSSSRSSSSSPSPPMAFASPVLPMSFHSPQSAPSPSQSQSQSQLGINGMPLATMPHPILPGQPLSGLASNARPLWLQPNASGKNLTERAAPADTLAEIMSKSTKPDLLRLPSTSSRTAGSEMPEIRPEQAVLATMASTTLLSKMRVAFWDAFAKPTPVEGKRKDWDPEKVRRVLEGTAVVRVVDVEPVADKVPEKTEASAAVMDPAVAMEEAMRALSVRSGNGASASAIGTVQMQTGVPNANSAGVDALTGVFSGLRLARTGAARS